MTDKQEENLKATVVGIRIVIKDEILVMNEPPMAAKRIQKRAGKVLIQDDAPPHLEYISTPPPDTNSNPSYGYTSSTSPSLSNPPDETAFRYAYLEDAGKNINGYWIDLYGRLDANTDEFTTHNIIEGNIRALRPAGSEWDGSDYGKPGHMLAAISLIAGFKFGVAKKSKLMLT